MEREREKKNHVISKSTQKKRERRGNWGCLEQNIIDTRYFDVVGNNNMDAGILSAAENVEL